MKLKDFISIGVVVALVATVALLWLSPGGINRAPDVAMQSIDGRMIQMSDYQGKPVLVTFWATSCPGCLKEMPHLIELHHAYGPRGLNVVGVAMAYDQPSMVVKLVKQKSVPYTIVLDLDSKIAQAFGDIRLTPTSFLIAPDGRIVQHKIGDLDLTKVRQHLDGWLS